MQLARNLEKSLYNQIKTILETPPGGFTNSFNVYGEDKFTDTSFSPTFPYVWLLGFRVPPRITRLPMIIIDAGMIRQSIFEIGNRGGNLALVNLYIYAKTRGERDDFGSFFRDYLYNIPVYNYSASPATFLSNVQVDGFSQARISLSEGVAMDGALSNAVACSFALQTLQ